MIKQILNSKVSGSTVVEVVYKDGTRAIEVDGCKIVTQNKLGNLTIDNARTPKDRTDWEVISKRFKELTGYTQEEVLSDKVIVSDVPNMLDRYIPKADYSLV